MWNIQKHVKLSNDDINSFMSKKTIIMNDNEGPIQTSSPVLKRKSKKRCNADNCKKKLSYIDVSIGCTECHYYFCGNHRLPEDHNCFGLDMIKHKSKQLLETKLINEKCAHEKVIKI